MDWQPIDTAPKDGSPVRTMIREAEWVADELYAITSRWIDGKWHANFGSKEHEEWKPYSPQPTLWKPV